MPSPRNRRHILVPNQPRVEHYTPHGRNIPPWKPPAPESRVHHGPGLKTALEAARTEQLQRNEGVQIQVHGAIPGLYIEFQSQPGIPLKLDSLENKSQGIELVAVTSSPAMDPEQGEVERATVFVPEGKLKHFVSRFERYAHDTSKKKRERRYEDMIDPIATLCLATLRALWTDAPEAFPSLYPTGETAGQGPALTP